MRATLLGILDTQSFRRRGLIDTGDGDASNDDDDDDAADAPGLTLGGVVGKFMYKPGCDLVFFCKLKGSGIAAPHTTKINNLDS